MQDSSRSTRPKTTKNSSSKAEDNPLTRIRSLIKNLDLELLKLCKPVPKRSKSYANVNNSNAKLKQNSSIRVRKSLNDIRSISHQQLRGRRSSTNSISSSLKYNRPSDKSLNQIRTNNVCRPSFSNISIRRSHSYHLGSINKSASQLKRSISKSIRNGSHHYLSKTSSKSSTRTQHLYPLSKSSSFGTKLFSSISIRNSRSSLSRVSSTSRYIHKTVPRFVHKIVTKAAKNTNNNIIKHTNNIQQQQQQQQQQPQQQHEPLKLKSNFTKTTGAASLSANRNSNSTVVRNLNSSKGSVGGSKSSFNRLRLHGGTHSKHSLSSNRSSRLKMNHLLNRSPGDNLGSGMVQTKTLSSVYRAKVIDAFRNRRIFMVIGNYGSIRRALLKRGWLEKLTPNRYPRLQLLNEDALLQHAKRGNEYEAVAISKIINHFPAFFIWQPRGHRDVYDDVQPYRNRIRRNNNLDFATKVGLIGCAEQQQWHRQEGVSRMLYPRFFRLGGAHQEQSAFIDEFRMTQCYSLLRFLSRHGDADSAIDIVDYMNGSISPNIIHFAYERVRRQLDNWDNVNSLDAEHTPIPESEWQDFLLNSARLLNNHAKLKSTHKEVLDLMKKIKHVMHKLEEKRPDFKFDGCRNLWILKPGYQCRGLNIIIRNNLEEILNWANNHSSRRYIVQKYIEQPLLIYRTKFDIRQYMLLYIRESTIQIWLYKDCYLRFSSQEYSIDDLREVIHLTNNSVQKKYKNRTPRDPRLPKNNMWSLDQFKAFINKQTISDDIWESRVFAGFKQNLIAVVSASLDETTFCENSFELYGCDFMLDEHYNPILIEINASPDLSPSTEVTARICPMVLQDVVKVVVDLPRNRLASTGLFQHIYEVNYKFRTDINHKESLSIHGKSMALYKKERSPLQDKFVKKAKKDETNMKQQQQKPPKNVKKTVASVKTSPKKSSSPLKTLQKPLKAATKEALAIRYTMPK